MDLEYIKEVLSKPDKVLEIKKKFLELEKTSADMKDAFNFFKEVMEVKFIERMENSGVNDEKIRFTYIQIKMNDRHYLHLISHEVFDKYKSQFPLVSKIKRKYTKHNPADIKKQDEPEIEMGEGISEVPSNPDAF